MSCQKIIFIPSNLNLKDLLSKKDLKHIDKYHYFLHKIHEERVMNKMNKNLDGWVALNARTLQTIISERQYSKIKSFLIENKIIECDNQYFKGESSMYYRLTDTYRKSKVVDVSILDNVFENKLKRHKDNYLETLLKKDKTLNFLYFNLNRLNINAIDCISSLANELLITKDINSFNSNVISTLKINNKDYFFNRDLTGNRVHNNFSNQPKNTLKFNYLDTGEELVNLDIRNSQPLLLSILLREEFGYVNIPEDVAIYISLCEEGMFYEYVAEKINVDLNIVDRSKFKQDFFAKIFYCKNGYSLQTKEAKIFREYFPNVFNFIYKKKEKNYKDLAISMQQIESKIVIDGVIRKIANTYTPEDFFCLTRHDSIYTTANKAELVKKMLLTEFEQYALNPTINNEKY